jgi:hypothetical protein
VTASQSTLVIVDPLVSLLIGIGLFGDNLQTGGARGPLESLSLIVLFGGVYFLARSPLVATVRSEEEEAQILGGRFQRRHHLPLGLLGAEGAAELSQELATHHAVVEPFGGPGSSGAASSGRASSGRASSGPASKGPASSGPASVDKEETGGALPVNLNNGANAAGKCTGNNP